MAHDIKMEINHRPEVRLDELEVDTPSGKFGVDIDWDGDIVKTGLALMGLAKVLCNKGKL